MALFAEFVRNTVKDPDAATLRGLERRFADRLQIQPVHGCPGGRAMNIFKLVHVVIARAFYRWALSEMNPLHPDLPKIVLRRQELADEARRLLA